MTISLRMSSLFPATLIFLFVQYSSSQNCNFAQNYDLNTLLNDPVQQDNFLMSASYWEGKFATDRIGLNYASALTYDGTMIDYNSGLPRAGGLHEFSAASKESVHVSLLALALEGKSKYAVNFFQGGKEAAGWTGTVQDYVIDQLTKKITSYENFNQQYPGFGGYIPWYTANDTGMHLLWDWIDRVPSLDNGELIWGLIAAVQVLYEKNLTALGDRYRNQVSLMAKYGLTIFYEGAGTGNIRCVSKIRNVTAIPTPANYYRQDNDPCNLDDPYEGETFTFFVDLYSDWSVYGPDDRNKHWMNKRAKLQAINFNSSFGPITVERGWWHSSHEKWKFMELPYFDVPLMNQLFLNGERARTQFSRMHSYPGLFAAVTNVTLPNNYDLNYLSAVGIEEIAFEKVVTNALATPYGAFPLLLHPNIRKYGIVWYASMLQGSKMQGPQGSTEAVSNQGDLISPMNTWDTKITSVFAFSGGVLDITRRYLQNSGKYMRFTTVIAEEWSRVFGDDNLLGSNIDFAVPLASVPNNLPMFTACVVNTTTPTTPPTTTTTTPSTPTSTTPPTTATTNCNFAQNYDLNTLLNDPVQQDNFLMSASYWEGKFATDRIGLNYASALTYDGTMIDYNSGLPRAGGLHEFSAASKESVHVSLLALALEGKSKYAVNFFQGGKDAVGWTGTVQDYVIDQLTKKITSYENFNQQYPGFGGYIPWYTANDTGMHLLWDWVDRVPSLDNGELIWGLIAAVQVLYEKNMTALGDRYRNQVSLMAKYGLTIFYEGAGTGNIRCVSKIRNVTATPTPANYYRQDNDPCNLDDPYEGETFTFFVDLYSDWSVYGPDDRNKHWMNKRAKLQAVNFNSSFGPITVERGWWHSSHEKWKFMELPYFDVPLMNQLFLNGERARTQFSRMHSYPGLFAAVTNVTLPNNYDLNYLSAVGIEEIAFEKVVTNALATPYGAFPLLLHPNIRKYGIVWYASMLQGSKMQGPQGSTEAVSNQGDLISPMNTWDTKITSIFAFSGGVLDITRRYLQNSGKYMRFTTVIAEEWSRVFGNDNLLGSNIDFAVPLASVPNNLPMFTACVATTTTTTTPPTTTSTTLPTTTSTIPSTTTTTTPPTTTSATPPTITSTTPPTSSSTNSSTSSPTTTTSSSNVLAKENSIIFVSISLLVLIFR